MKLPKKLKQLCQEYFEEIEEDPEHLFTPALFPAFKDKVEAALN